LVAYPGKGWLLGYYKGSGQRGEGCLHNFSPAIATRRFSAGGFPIFDFPFSIRDFCSLEIPPIWSCSHLHHHRHRQFIDVLHFFFHQRFDFVLFLCWQFEQQLVVHL